MKIIRCESRSEELEVALKEQKKGRATRFVEEIDGKRGFFALSEEKEEKKEND